MAVLLATPLRRQTRVSPELSDAAPPERQRVPSSPGLSASIAAAPERHGSHHLERLGEAVDSAFSFVQAFLHVVWAKRSLCYEVLMRVVRLLLFSVLLIPGWIPATLHYLRGPGVTRGVRYGPSARHKLDLYIPDAASSPPPAEGYPTVLFVCGGAWMIGYRMWGFLFGWGLQRNGVVCAAIDYRNWPQVHLRLLPPNRLRSLCHNPPLSPPISFLTTGQKRAHHSPILQFLRFLRRGPFPRWSSSDYVPLL